MGLSEAKLLVLSREQRRRLRRPIRYLRRMWVHRVMPPPSTMA
jgi:hypothetical protein